MAASQTTSVIRSPAPSTVPRITNLSVPTANTEVPHILVTPLTQMLIRNRTNGDLKLSFVVAESGTKYVTIPGCASLHLSDLGYVGGTLYVQSPVAAQTVEILEWS